MLNRHPKATASALIMCCLSLAVPSAAQGQDTPKPADPTPASESSNAADHSASAPDTAPQATEVAQAAEQGSEDAARVSVQLIRVRSEWSQGKDPQGTQKTLDTLLKDSPLPDYYREALLSNAPRILFPEGFVACYRVEQFADSLAWMKARDLARIDGRAEPSDRREYRYGTQKSVIHQTTLYVGEDVVPIEPTLVQEATPPFVKRTLGWEWTVESRLGTGTGAEEPTIELSIMRSMMQKDELQVDAEKPTVTTDSLSGRLSGARIPADKVAVIRCFDENDRAYGMSMSGPFRDQDWVPLLVVAPITHGKQEASDDPHLAKPASMIKQTSWRPSWTPEMYSRTSPIVMGSPPPSPEQAKADKQGVVFRLKHADPNQVIQALTAVAPNASAVTDDRLKSVIVTASKDDLAAVENLLKELDQPGEPPAPNTVPTRPEEKQLKIFRLVHSRANQVAAILQQLFPEIVLTEDERTNSLIALGDRRPMEIAEALLQRLDETPSEKQEPPLDEASRRQILETASGEFASAEAEIQSIVASIAGEADQKKAEQLRARLAGLVAQAFDLRQNLQRAELALLKERVGIIESRLGQRDSLRDEIIKRRVEGLLAGGMPSGGESTVAPKGLSDGMVSMGFRNQPWADVLEWLAGVLGAKLQVNDTTPEGTFNYTSPKPVSLGEAKEVIQAALRPNGYVIREGHDGKTRLLVVSLSDELRWCRRAVEAQEEVTKWRLALEDEESKNDAGYRAALETRLQAAQNSLATSQRIVGQQLANKTAGYQNAESSLQAARQSREDLTKLRVKGHVTQEEVDAAEKHLQRLNEAFESARAVREVLREAAETAGLSPAEIKEAEALGEDIARKSREETSGARQEDTLQGATPQVSEPSSGMPSGPRPTLRLRTPEEFQRAASDARVSIERLRNRMHTKDEYEGIERDLASAQQRLTMIQAEFATQLRLLESEVRKAELEYGVAQSEWRTVDDTVREVPNAFSKNEVDKYRATSEVAKAQLEQAKALLELYLKAGENPDLNPGFGGDSNESSVAVERPQTRVLTGTTLPLRSPEEFALAAREAVVELRRASTMKVRERRENEDPAEYEKFVASERKGPLAWAQQRLDLVREEFAAQVHWLELEVHTMEAAATTAQEELQRLTSLFKSGAAPSSQVSDAKLKAEQASVRLEQAKTLLELYLKAGENPDLKGSDSAPVEEAGKATQSLPATTSLPPQGTVAAAATPAPRLALRSPEEFLRVANEARDRVKSLQNEIEQAGLRRAEVKKGDVPNLESAIRDMEAELTSAQQRLELIQAEYAAQIQLLESELASAKSRLSFAQQAMYRDARTGAERTKMAQDREQAKSQCEQAQILLDLYRKAGEKAGLNPVAPDQPPE